MVDHRPASLFKCALSAYEFGQKSDGTKNPGPTIRSGVATRTSPELLANRLSRLVSHGMRGENDQALVARGARRRSLIFLNWGDQGRWWHFGR